MTRETDSGIADILLDTNVQLDIVSLGDLLRERDEYPSLEEALRSRDYRFRQLRARHSLLLAFQLAKRRINTGSLADETFGMLSTKLSPTDNKPSHALSSIIVHVIRPIVFRGWGRGALVGIPPGLKGEAADDALFDAARMERLPLVTNEGLTNAGYVLDKPNGLRNLRGRCVDAGIDVYSPAEYLRLLGVSVAHEGRKFVDACHRAALKGLEEKLVEGPNINEIVNSLLNIYLFVMCDDESWTGDACSTHAG